MTDLHHPAAAVASITVPSGRDAAPSRAFATWVAYALVPPLLVATLYGLLVEDAYDTSASIIAQGRGQDLLTLITVPVLLWAASGVGRRRLDAALVLVGLEVYVAYSYASYAFGVPVNAVFIAYVAALGLSSYGAARGLLALRDGVLVPEQMDVPSAATSWLLLLVAGVFTLLWLSELAAAWPDGDIASAFVPGMSNPIHVLDLGLLLPAFATVGWQLRRGAAWAPAVAAVLLVKVVTLTIAVLLMVVFMWRAGEPVDPVMPWVFVAVGVVSVALLARVLRAAAGTHATG